MRIFFLLIGLLLFSPSYAQFHNNVWVLGNASFPNTILNFNQGSGSLMKSIDSTGNPFVTVNSSICDQNGNLIFYTNGVNVYDSTHHVMQNGDNLNPCLVTTQDSASGLDMPQGALSLPYPGNDSLFYLFHVGSDMASLSNWDLLPGKILYSVINKNMNGGLGAVIAKNVVLYVDSFVAGQLSACKHANGRDWWLINHKVNTDLYFKWLITPNAILGPYNQFIGSVIEHNINGQSVFSPDGSKYVNYTSLADSLSNQHIDVFDFDRCTGILSNLHTIVIADSSLGGHGCAISANSRFLYLSTQYFIYQFDLLSPGISSSKIKVATFDGFNSPPGFYTTFYMMQLALDQNIYMSCLYGTDYMHIIENPNQLGVGCNVIQHGLQLPQPHAFEIPNQPYYQLGALTGSPCDTLTGVFNSSTILNDLTLSPNPVKDKLTLQLHNSNTEITQLEIMNTLGELVFQKPLRGFEVNLDIGFLHSGVYFVRVYSTHGVGVNKFVKE